MAGLCKQKTSSGKCRAFFQNWHGKQQFFVGTGVHDGVQPFDPAFAQNLAMEVIASGQGSLKPWSGLPDRPIR